MVQAMNECCVCMHEYDNQEGPKMPVSLDCGHAICKECATNMRDTAYSNN